MNEKINDGWPSVPGYPANHDNTQKIEDQLTKVADEINNITKIEKIKISPAVDVEGKALYRMNTLLGEITSTTIEELTILRSQIDLLIQSIQTRNNDLKKAFQGHVQYSIDAVQSAQIIKENVQSLSDKFNGE